MTQLVLGQRRLLPNVDGCMLAGLRLLPRGAYAVHQISLPLFGAFERALLAYLSQYSSHRPIA